MNAPAFILLVLHSVTGAEITISAGEITAMREAREDDADDKLVTKGVRCVVSMTDGKFASVVEACSDVRRQVEQKVRDRLDKIESEPQEGQHERHHRNAD